MDGKSLTADDIKKLADLESREVLLAKLAGAMTASLSGAVALFAAPLAQTARLVEALRAKAEQDPSVLRGGAGTPAEPVAEEAPVADAVEAEPETAEVAEPEVAEPRSAEVAEASADASSEATTDEAQAESGETSTESSTETSTESSTETSTETSTESTEG